MQILLIDDDDTSSDMLTAALEQVGYQVQRAADGQTGLQLALTKPYDLIVLDIVLPGLDGFSICRRVRECSAVPIIVVSACHDETHRIAGLNLGADDYVGKPYSLGELLSRIRSVLRRRPQTPPAIPSEVLTAGDLRLDLGSRRVFRGETEIRIKPKDFALLTCLMRRAGTVVSRDTLQQEVWGANDLVAARTIDVHIRWLRLRIEPDPARPRYIETVPGVGYRVSKSTC